MILTDFQLIRPRFETKQEEIIEWLCQAHAKAGRDIELLDQMRQKFAHVGCKPEHIEKRGHILRDHLHTNWEEMEVYKLHKNPTGENLSHRSKIYSAYVEEVFEKYYPENSSAPDDIIHVSCTGYVSPNGAQKIVSKRNWGQSTTVTNAYHMGCYGSIPAIRIGRGFLAADHAKKKIDIVHTEICSLHSNPANHKLDQLVSQSLFADGCIKYSIEKKTNLPHLRVIALKEEIIPNSTESMTWNAVDWGNEMYLAKEVPVLISRYLPSYLDRLGISTDDQTLFAIHPGGPKILQYIQKLLNLKPHQIKYSQKILKNYGNMSSATLPHIWDDILKEASVESGTKIVSLAFGPGLSISGGLMEKVCGS